MDPSVQPPYQPPQMPPQVQPPYQQPPRKGLSTGAIVGIIAGITVLIATIAAVVIILVTREDTTKTADRDTSRLDELAPPNQDSDQNPANIGPTKSYKNTRISFNYPEFMSQKDLSSTTTYYTDGTIPSDEQVFLSGKESGSSSNGAIINYSGQWSSTPAPVDKARRVAAMKQGIEAQKNSSSSQVLAMRASTAHGCAANFTYTSQPTLIESGELVGMKYGYTCQSYYGNVQGEYFVWYDTYGSKHSLTVDALADYWKAHRVDLEAVTKSVTLLSTGA